MQPKAGKKSSSPHLPRCSIIQRDSRTIRYGSPGLVIAPTVLVATQPVRRDLRLRPITGVLRCRWRFAWHNVLEAGSRSSTHITSSQVKHFKCFQKFNHPIRSSTVLAFSSTSAIAQVGYQYRVGLMSKRACTAGSGCGRGNSLLVHNRPSDISVQLLKNE